jgi:hypothetical protein
MKKIFVGFALAALSASSFAANTHGPAGCGLGTEVIFRDANEWHEHVLAATTNGTSGNQTFGITSGTLGCQDAGGPLAADVNSFIDANLEQIAADTARGDGETLQALADVIGIEQADQPHFKAQMQANFDTLFPGEQTTSGQTYNGVVTVMAKDAALSKYLG